MLHSDVEIEKKEDMKKRDILRLAVVTVGLFLSGGCSDFLEEESQDEVIPKTVTDFSELLMGSGYPSTAYYPGSILAQLDDDKMLDRDGENVLGSTGAEEWFPAFTWQPDLYRRDEGTPLASTEYYMWYERIKGCNAVLDYIDDAIGTQSEREQVKAEALALRAYYYFWLVNLYGEPYNYNKEALGVPLKLTSTVQEEVGGVRNTVKEVYEQILKDLDASAKLFEKYNVVIGNYRMNLPAVKILLSRVYLYMEEWQNAVNAANDAIELGRGLTDLTLVDENVNYCMNSYDVNETVCIFGARIDNYSMAYVVSSDLLKLFNSKDRRIGIYIIAQYSGGGDFTGWLINKNAAAGEPGQCLRLAEAYLNRAEAYSRLTGKQSDALADLNTLRKHRIMDYRDVSIADPTALLDTIRKERRLELCYEGHRWFDLRRYGMPEITHIYQESTTSPAMVYTLKEKDPMYTLPLPSSVMDKNKELVQNASDKEPLRVGVSM